jgi:serine/threonine protein phosphatase PrpC
MTHTFVTASATHIGGRDTNEDAVVVSDGLFAVADGIGGLQDGDVASRLALDTLDVPFAADRTVSGLLDACQEANRAVWGQANGQDNIMGTTLVDLAMTSDAAGIVLHAGDSRLYRLRNGRLEQLTHDHTIIADLGSDWRAQRRGRSHPSPPIRPHASDRRIPTCRRRPRWGILRTRRSPVALQRRPLQNRRPSGD